MKFEGTAYCDEIRTVDTHPATAKKMGQTRRVPLRADWETVKESIMLEALLAKFKQHASLRSILVESWPRLLVEHTAQDAYWGDAGDGSGQNRLGVCLMRVRHMLRQTAAPVAAAVTGASPADGVDLTARSSTTTADTEAPHTAAVSHMRPRKRKAHRKRAVYSDADGTPLFDKATSQTVRVAGTLMNISARALTPSARLVVHQFQHTKKRNGVDSDAWDDLSEDEEDYEEESEEHRQDVGNHDTSPNPGDSSNARLSGEMILNSLRQIEQLFAEIKGGASQDELLSELQEENASLRLQLQLLIERDALTEAQLEAACAILSRSF